MLIYVTNRKLCKDDFLKRIGLLADSKPHAIILREKDMGLLEFESLAKKVKSICETKRVDLIINRNIETALKLGIPNIHLSMEYLRIYRNETAGFIRTGVSVHSIAEAREAQETGAGYLIAGHIFATGCKEGIPSKGLVFLEEICKAVTIPVFAIGGITSEKVKNVRAAGAKGVCIMSEAMRDENPERLSGKFGFQ